MDFFEISLWDGANIALETKTKLLIYFVCPYLYYYALRPLNLSGIAKNNNEISY